MEGSNLHTSVVIELANQDDVEDQKTVKSDFDDMGIPKDYVIDQIFCGENITIYALFEISDRKNKNSDAELLEIKNSTVNDDFRFIHRNSFKKALQRQSNSHRMKLPEKDDDCDDDDDEEQFSRCSRKESFYCLKHLGQKYEVPLREDSPNLKVLFNKDPILKENKQVKLKAVSKGVNTDIVQSPKIIDDIQKAINSNYLARKEGAKTMNIKKALSGKSSNEIIDVGMQKSSLSYSSSAETVDFKKSSPNFLFVPLLMVEETHTQKVFKNETLQEESKCRSNKVSFGTNTGHSFDPSPEKPDSYEREKKRSELESRKPSKESALKADDEKEKLAKSHLKKKDKVTILNEIKKLQGKLNSLIKSIEFNEFFHSTDDDDNFSENELRKSEEILKKLDKVLEPQQSDTECIRRTQNKFDDIPIFSQMSFTSASKTMRIKKRAAQGDGGEEKPQPIKSASSNALTNPCEVKKPEVKPKNVFSGLNINWEAKGGKGLVPSKSDTNSPCNLLLPKYNCVKKSVSFDQRDDKIEIYCLKKIKNSSFKFEGSLKTNLRILQSGEVRLGENLTLLRREMGDEVKTKLRACKVHSRDFSQSSEQEEIMFFKKGASRMKKPLNEEEGDAKMVCLDKSLISQKFVQNQVIQFCRPNAIASDALLKSLNAADPSGVKLKMITKVEESTTKIPTVTDKPTTLAKNHRKSRGAEPDAKKEAKPIRKFNKNKPLEKKNEKKEGASHDTVKPKSLSGSRKFTVKGTVESKLNDDKQIKAENEIKSETPNSQKGGKANTDERPGSRSDRLHQPRSQKRELRETPNETSTNVKKEMEKKEAKKKSEMEAEGCSKRAPPEAEVKKNVAHRKHGESKKEIIRESEPSTEENPIWLSSNSSSVIVELLSEKPSLDDDFYAEMNDENGKIANAAGERRTSKDNCREKSNGSPEKPVLKSVWALTKVLLYEDGTKKLEVLEASLTPPGYCLKSEENPTENIQRENFLSPVSPEKPDRNL